MPLGRARRRLGGNRPPPRWIERFSLAQAAAACLGALGAHGAGGGLIL